MTNRYDTAQDLVSKAFRGTGARPEEIAAQTGLPLDILRDYAAGKSVTPDLDTLGNALGLNGSALQALDTTPVHVPLPPGIEQLELPFDDETVNAWWLELAGQKLLIDSGVDPTSLEHALAGRRPDTICITHPHHDHIGGLALFSTVPVHYGNDLASHPLPWGDGNILVLPLPGHHPAAWGYFYQAASAEHSWFATGDALFAGSMGGCANPESFTEACRSLGKALRTLPDHCLLLPGHGPATTLALECRQNPFAPFWSAE